MSTNTVNQPHFPFVLPPLPFDKNNFNGISVKTFEYHHEKHHNAYVTNLNNLVKGTEFEKQTLEQIIKNTANHKEKLPIFNNAAQVWNHTFFWNSLSPNVSSPSQNLKNAIDKSFGSYESFAEQFKSVGVSQFGSGWVWLVKDPTKPDASASLSIIKTPNAETPITQGLAPLLTCDVWEHAYYIDYHNRRADFLSDFIAKFANWSFAEANFKA